METLWCCIELVKMGESAEYSSVVTSICVVEDVKTQGEFGSFDEFYNYASKYSVFDKKEFKILVQ